MAAREEPQPVYVGFAAAPDSFFLSHPRVAGKVSQDLLRVFQAEELIMRLAETNRLVRYPLPIPKHALVALKVVGTWRRGRVIRPPDPASSADVVPMVLLLDTGDVVQKVAAESLHHLPENVAVDPPHLFFKGRLAGLLPLARDGNPGQRWSSSAFRLTKRLVDEAERVELVHCRSYASVAGEKPCDLLLHLPAPGEAVRTSGALRRYEKVLDRRRTVSLREVLVDAGFASLVRSRSDSMRTASSASFSDERRSHQARRKKTLEEASKEDKTFVDNAVFSRSSTLQDLVTKDISLASEKKFLRPYQHVACPNSDKGGLAEDNSVMFKPLSASTPHNSPAPSEKDVEVRPEPLNIKETTGFLPSSKGCGNATMPASKLVVHQDPSSRKIKLIDRASDLHWSVDVSLYLDHNGITHATRIQTALWPAVLSHNSLVCVGDAKAGRTLGYLLPLLNTLSLMPMRASDSPAIVILSVSWKRVEIVHQKIREIVRNAFLQAFPSQKEAEKIRIIASHKDIESDLVVDLANGCHVLVATVPSLKRLLQADAVRLGRCRHLVFEEADEIFHRFSSTIRHFMKLVPFGVSDDKSDRPLQVILTSQRWTRGVQQFVSVFLVRKAKEMALAGPVIVASGLEAAVYGRVNSKARFCPCSADKITYLRKIVKACAGKKVTILCRDYESGSEVASELQELGIAFYFLHEQLLHSVKSKDIIQQWREGLESSTERKRVPLIMTDNACIDSVTDADVLVHYDIPVASKKLFSRRYAHVLDNLVSVYGDDASDPAVSYLLLTKEDAPKLKTLIGFLRSSAQFLDEGARAKVVPEKIEILYVERQIEEAVQRVGSSLCDELKLFGKCQRKMTCVQRHFFDENAERNVEYLAASTTATTKVLFKIGHIFSPVHFQVGLANQSGSASFRKARLRLSLLLGRLCESPPPAMALGELAPGLECITADPADGTSLRRARILSVSSQGLYCEAEVLLVDEGVVVKVSDAARHLKQMPQQLALSENRPLSFEVILSGLMPHDGDSEWGSMALDVASGILSRAMLRDHDGRGQQVDVAHDEWFCQGDVLLSVADMIWVSEITVGKVIKSGLSPCARLRSGLLEGGWVEEHPDNPVRRLRRSAFRLGLTESSVDGNQAMQGHEVGQIPETSPPEEEVSQGDKPEEIVADERPKKSLFDGAEGVALPSDSEPSELCSAIGEAGTKINSSTKQGAELDQENLHTEAKETEALEAMAELAACAPPLSIVYGITENTEGASPPLIRYTRAKFTLELLVNLSAMTRRGGDDVNHFVRVTKKSVKMQFTAMQPTNEDPDQKRHRYCCLFADLPILWLKGPVVPNKTSVSRKGKTLRVLLHCVNEASRDERKEPFCLTLADTKRPVRYPWLKPQDWDSLCEQQSQASAANYSEGSESLSLVRRRFFEAKLCATSERDLPAHPNGGSMPWEEGGDDGGANRTAAPSRPLAEFFETTEDGSASQRLDWEDDAGIGGDMDEYVLDWKAPLEVNPDR